MECAICQELTITRTEQVIQQPTICNTGSQEIRDRCHCCGNESTQSIILPALPPPSPVYSSSSQSSSTSSNSSDFGGGKSGGGGAGEDW
ncbi:hypothetical protein J0895_21940 [Phormidium pseudopriestleyi FRX01]|uniref:Uncharacterized protein n=1 Tax=Phormidium pseudopriestleyi FRX01 TaxID=1759528 RepID=A0ABS3FX29_9CYAN|nr:hypothetical protein [Phormidium pseudopriestleyi]MBO0351693.1 hypothetical protein [Phormidium pseudopriestleyi FRX01]